MLQNILTVKLNVDIARHINERELHQLENQWMTMNRFSTFLAMYCSKKIINLFYVFPVVRFIYYKYLMESIEIL